MKAVRRSDNTEPHLLEVGEYVRWSNHWYGRCPNGELCNLTNHNIIENRDGTLTVSPSILVNGHLSIKDPKYWHGYLTNNEWISV
jgi:hypothetical protein